jgi:hypothetical protein
MTLQTQYSKFSDKIALTRESDEYKEVREKDDLITPKIEEAFKEAGYKVEPNFLYGSFSTHTGTIPLFESDYDADRALVITKDSSPVDAVKPKKIAKQVLLEHGFKNPKIKKPCITANYESKPYHIDYIVYRLDSSGNYELAIGKENSSSENRYWADADPKGLITWITSNTNHQSIFNELTPEEKRQFYRLVRYIKRWRDFNFSSESQRKKVFSIALTVMLKESFKQNFTDEGKANDHSALKDTLDVILNDKNYFIYDGIDKYRIEVNLPVIPNRDIFDDKGSNIGTALKNKLEQLLDALNEVDEIESLKEQCELLQKHFGDDFPVPDESASKTQARVISPKAGFVGVSNGA